MEQKMSDSSNNHNLVAPISLGELIDKITILQIKSVHMQGSALENVRRELQALEFTLSCLQFEIDPECISRLKDVNQELWLIEDSIREHELRQCFGNEFIKLARSVYRLNDRRALIKREINTTYGSSFVEEKSYKNY